MPTGKELGQGRIRIYTSKHALEDTRIRTANKIAKTKLLISLTRKLLGRDKDQVEPKEKVQK